MQIGRTYKRPGKHTPSFFDGVDGASASVSFDCGSCRTRINLDLVTFLGAASNWESQFSTAELDELRKKIKFPTREIELPDSTKTLVKSHEGGSPFLSIVECNCCSHKHLIYIGYYEFQPSRYIGTLQGVYEAIT